MKLINFLLRIIFIAILTASFIVIGIINVFSSTVLDKNYVISKLEENNYYSEIYELVNSNFENYIQQSGLDESVIKNLVTEEKIKVDVNIIISNIYDGNNDEISTAEISEKLNQNIDDQNVKTAENEKQINEFVDCVVSEYITTILHTKYEDNINQVLVKVNDISKKLESVAWGAMAVSLFIFIIISLKSPLKIIENITSSFMAISLFNIIAHNIILKKININNIKVLNDAFSETLVLILNEIMSKILYFGIIMLVISILLCIILIALNVLVKRNDTVEE